MAESTKTVAFAKDTDGSFAANNCRNKTRLNENSNKKFQNLLIAAIINRDNHGEKLIREIQKTRSRVQTIWPVPEEIPSEFDVVFCEQTNDLPTRFKSIPGNTPVTLILVIPANTELDQMVLENSAPHAVIHLPCGSDEVTSALIVARSHFQYERRLRQRIEKLDENLRSMKTIERAKIIMMQSKNINEEEAYKQMRLAAMQRRITIGVLASLILDSQGLLS